MAEQFILRHETTEAVASYEAFSAAGTINQPYLEHIAVLGIYNQIESDCVTRIKKIEINELSGRTTTIPNAIRMMRTTAQSGGQSITPVKHDTNDASLPSQIAIAKNPYSVTTTGVEFRRLKGANRHAVATALTGFAAMRLGDLKNSLSNNNLYTVYEAETQGATLREGEGIALVTDNTSPPNFPYEISCKINVGSVTHNINTVVYNSALPCLFGIHNGSGSGVVLTVSRIELSEIRTTDILPQFTIETISGIYGGTDITPIKLDTSNTTIPSGLKLVSNCTVQQANIDSATAVRSRNSGDLPLRRVVRPPFGVSPALASGILTLQNRKHIVFDFSTIVDSDGGLVLREGQGLAIINRPNASGYANYEVIVHFTNAYTPAGGGGSGGAFTFVGG